MKSIANCKWKVSIRQYTDGRYFWTAETKDHAGLAKHDWLMGRSYKIKSTAIGSWKQFAWINDIADYKIISEVE